MSNAYSAQAVVAGPGFPRMALGLAWLGASVGTGVSIWFVDGLAGQLLLGVCALGFIATGAVVSNRNRRLTLAFSELAGIVMVAVGVATAALVSVTDQPDRSSAVAVGAVAVVGGLLTRRLSRRARRMAE